MERRGDWERRLVMGQVERETRKIYGGGVIEREDGCWSMGCDKMDGSSIE